MKKRRRSAFMDTARNVPNSKGISRSQLTKMVKKAIDGEKEKKGVDHVLPLGAISDTLTNNSHVYHATELNLGDAGYQRGEPNIDLDSIRVKGCIKFESRQELVLGTWEQAPVRIVILLIKDMEALAGNPAFSDVFGSLDNIGAQTTGLFDGVKFDRMGNVKVLRDVTLCPQGGQFMIHAGLTYHNHFIEIPFDLFVSLKGIEASYDPATTSGTASVMKKNGIFVMFKALQNSTHAQSHLDNVRIRLRWKE